MGRLAKVGHAKPLKSAKSLTPPLGTTTLAIPARKTLNYGFSPRWAILIAARGRVATRRTSHHRRRGAAPRRPVVLAVGGGGHGPEKASGHRLSR